MIRAVLFDMDGTITDTERIYNNFWEESACELGYDFFSKKDALLLRSLNHKDSAALLEELFGDRVDYHKLHTLCGQKVDTYLEENGYPVASGSGLSLSELYSSATSANHLFIQSIYNESGYFEYDSTQNYAYLNGSDFTVYDQLGTTESNFGESSRKHGMFLPYNALEGRVYSNVLYNLTDINNNELPDSDPRKGERLYKIPAIYYNDYAVINADSADYFFGMEMEAKFTQTASGLDAWGHDIIFEFSGDDDFWLYVDGMLVLDLGGIHSAQSGSVNFKTGVVKYRGQTTTLRAMFKAAYEAKNPSATEAEVSAYLDETFTLNADGQYVFRDYTDHTMKIFYMERGASASNLHMRFNLAAVRPGTFILSKKLSGTDSAANDLIEFPYQIWYRSEATGNWTTISDNSLVKYEGTTTNVTYQGSYTPAGGTTAYENVFFLKPGQSAEVTLPDDAVDQTYYVVECGVNPDVYDAVTANGVALKNTNLTDDPDKLSKDGYVTTGNTVGETARCDYKTSTDTTANRSRVEYINHVSEGAMRTLSITKKLYDTNGTTILTYPGNQTLFTFRLYLGTENATDIPLANLYSYYVKDSNGYYCKWDADQQKFVSLGVTEYSALLTYFETNNWTASQKESVIFKTSMNGSISKIPAGYTVEVRDLIVGTKWKVEERDWEIPKGYTRRDSDGYTRVDTTPEQPQSTPISGTMQVDESPQVEVRNQKGWGLTVEKVWSDKDFMESHDDIYFAVYFNEQKDSVPSNDTLIGGTVRRLKNGETEIYYFFDDLRAGTENTTYTFDQYVVREVNVTPGDAFKVDENTGIVTGYSSVAPIYDNGTLNIGGQTIGGEHQAAGEHGFQYTVTYVVGESTGHNENIRTDTGTNSRPGIKLYKTLWDGITVLAGAKFTLTDNQGNNVAAESYTSRASDGLITIAYLNPGKYTLKEIETPKGYVALSQPMTITVNNDGTVSVSGVGAEYYYLTQAVSATDTTDAEMAKIVIKNRSVEFKVKKVDAATGNPIAGVHFALYNQVTNTAGESVRDYLPIAGYADLVTNAQGILMFANEECRSSGGCHTHKPGLGQNLLSCRNPGC